MNSQTPIEVIFSTKEHPSVAAGLAQPARIIAQTPETCIAICDASHRSSGLNGCNFVVDLRGEITRARTCRISKVIMPKVPTINTHNDTITIRHALDLGTPITFTIPWGWKNQVSLINDLKLSFDLASVGLPDIFTVTYDAGTHVISIASNGGHLWFFSDACTFIRYGVDVHGFQGLPVASNPAVVGSITQYSSSASFVYTRYVTLHSQTLSRYVRTQSRTSSGDLSVVAGISVVEDLSASDFDTSGLFTGSSITEVTLQDAPKQAFDLNHGVLQIIDFQLFDQFCFPLYESINISPSHINTFNCVVWLSLDL